MLSHAFGLTWAFWRKGRLYLLTAPLVLAFLPSLIFIAFYLEGVWPSRDSQQLVELGSMLHLPFLLYGVPYIAFIILWLQGDPRRQYTLPVSTWTLVGSSMANGLIWSAGILAVFVGIARVALGVAWPIWGPALLGATGYACTQAAIWGLNRSVPLRILASAALVFAFPYCVIYRYGTMRWESPGVSHSVTILDVVVMAAIVGVAYLLTVAGVALDRRGEGICLGGLKRYWPLTNGGTCAERRPAPTAASAQFRYEWRQRGRFIPPCVAIYAICFVVWCFSPEGEVRYIIPGIAQCSIFLVFAGFLVGMYLGHRSNLGDIGSFEATRPLTDHQLAMAILKNVAITVATSAALWIGLLAIPVAVYYLAGRRPELFEFGEPVRLPTIGDRLGFAFVCCWFAWTPVALGATLILARRRLVHAIIFAVPVTAILGLFVFNWGVPDEFQSDVLQAITATIGVICVLGAPVGFLLLHRRGITDGRALRRGLGIWALIAIVVVAIAGLLFSSQGFPTVCESILLLGLGTLPIAPFALAPLAVAWNRHR